MLLNLKHNKHQQHLTQLPKIHQIAADIKTLYTPKDFFNTLMQIIASAQKRIYLVALYLEQDQGGQVILKTLYKAKYNNPLLEIAILVDWHRAQRGLIGVNTNETNADWYYRMAQEHRGIEVPIYGVPVNTHEAIGVLHLKGFIIDTQVIYSGASLNNVYLHQLDKYRYDRYHIIHNNILADTLLQYIKQHLLTSSAVNRLDKGIKPKKLEIKHNTRLFRQAIRKATYCYQGNDNLHELAITPLVGLGKQNPLNKTIHHLLCSTCNTLILCTPYFNLPTILVRDLINLLRLGRQVEIIVGDKTANDFYIPENQPFKIIGVLPYLYEINLRHFISQLQQYINTGQLMIHLWKNDNNSYHLKGVWVDDKWQLLTGNNFNPRAWRLDLENALLIYDPAQLLRKQREKEINYIRNHTQVIKHFTEIDSIANYPVNIRKFIKRIRRIHIDRLISHIL